MVTKLDMGRAWNDATALISANLRVILIVAGVFVFLPNAISALAMPQSAELEAMMGSADTAVDPEAMFEVMTAYYAEIWWVFVIVAVIQAVGVLGLLALLTDRSRPTVGEALMFGLKALLPYLLAQVLASTIIVAMAVVLLALGSAINPALAVLLGLVSLVLAVYAYVKFSLTSPVIAIEKQLNPVKALMRSWRLTKGNSLRLFFFYLLLLIVIMVIVILSGMIFSIFALAGEEAGKFASGIGGALVSMGIVIVMLAVLAAVHRQLAGTVAVEGTFD